MVKAVIFDMDGILIDSEPLWKIADIEAYGKVGIKLTAEECAQTTGMDTTSAVKYWFEKFPWNNRSLKEVQDDIESIVKQLIIEKGESMPGVEYIFSFFEKLSIPIALASSSSMHIIEAVISKLNIKSRLKVYHSAQYEKEGKPNPAVFLSTAKLLNVEPENCLVFEDSINGIKAAKNAKMKVVAIPDSHFKTSPQLAIADMILNSFLKFDSEKLNKLQNMV